MTDFIIRQKKFWPVVLMTAITLSQVSASAFELGEKILVCKGERISDFDPIDSFGPAVTLTVLQHQSGPFNWTLDVAGKTEISMKTNGPINSNGSTVAPNGDEHRIFFRNAGDGLMLKTARGVLEGLFQYIETIPGETEELNQYYLVDYKVHSCELTGVEINQNEANIYSAKSELADSAVSSNPVWLNGVGVQINENGGAESVVLFAQDEAQRDRFLKEFEARGRLVVDANQQIRYKFRREDGSEVVVPMFVQITGDIQPPRQTRVGFKGAFL